MWEVGRNLITDLNSNKKKNSSEEQEEQDHILF